MKKIYFITFFLVLSLMCSAQWYVVDTIPLAGDCGANPLGKTFKFLSPDEAYWYWQRPGCTPSNTPYFAIQRTENSFLTELGFLNCGGSIASDGRLYDIDFISYDTVYISCACMNNGFPSPNSGFIRTTDGGNSWVQLSSVNRPANLHFVNSHLGYGFNNDSLYRFYNDSIYFVSKVSNFTIDYYQMYFLDDLTGFILLQPSQFDYTTDTIIRTIDGGQTWSEVFVESGRIFSSFMEPLNSSFAYIYADSGCIYKTSNAGSSWIKILQNDTLGYIHFLNEHRAYSISADTAHNVFYNVSDNGGLSWSSVNVSNMNNAVFNFNVKIFNDSVGYINVMSHTGNWYYYVILKTTNNGGIIFNSPDSSIVEANSFIISPNPSHGDFLVTIPDEFRDQENLIFQLFDNTGKLIEQTKIEKQQEKIKVNLEEEAKGVYNVTLSNGKKSYNGKIIFQ
jgi:type IX secretion system substrate protein